MTTSYILDKASKYFIAMLVGALIMLFLFRSCEPTTVTTPTVTGTIKDTKPVINTPIKTPKPLKIPWPITEGKTDTLIVENSINIDIFNKYAMAKDSISKLNILIEAITKHNFTKHLEDNYVSIDAFGVATGTVDSLGLSYKLKPQKVAVPSLKWHIKAGGEIGSDGQRTAAKANLFYESKKGNEIQFGYDTERRYWIGGNLIIF